MQDLEACGPTSHFYVSQRLRLHFVDWGNPSAPPLLLLHGGRDHARSWDWVARALRHDYHIIAPDLRGHGDSAWSPEGCYEPGAFIYDVAQLLFSQGLQKVKIVAHSFGAMIALRYAGLYPDQVEKLVAIEGLNFIGNETKASDPPTVEQRWRRWVEEMRAMSGRLPKRYPSIEDALQRMQTQNKHLSPEQARHLTLHGIARNEDGTYGWKFDNYIWGRRPTSFSDADLHRLWSQITCPVLLAYGEDGWTRNPAEDGSLALFQNAKVATFTEAGHWLHHDQFDKFMGELRAFL